MIRDHDETPVRAEEPARAPQPGGVAAEPAAAHLQALQRSAGNAAVMRMLRSRGLMREPGPGAVCSPADQAKLEELMSTMYFEEDYHPSTGIGLFDAFYSPADGDLTITVGISFNFLNGDPTNATWVARVGGPAAAAAFTADQFTWTADEILQWKENAISQITAIWGGRHVFFTQKDCWAATLPPVNVGIEILERPATGDDKAHFVTSVTKWPTDPGLTESVTDPSPTGDQSTGEFHESGNNGITNPDVNHFVRGPGFRARYGEATRDNPGTIQFPQNVTEPSAADKARLQTFGRTLGQPYMPPFPITLTAHSSSEGEEDLNLRLSEDRGRAVSNEIVGAGAKRQPTVDPQGETGAADTPEWRRVDIAIGDFESDQTTVAHEFGHMIGLDDEYPTADAGARPVGTEVGHSALAQRLIPGQQPIVAHHDEDIMSNGEVVRPHHYVTFLEVLGKMTDTEGTWDVRPAVSAPGDFPVPAPDGTAVV